MKISNLYKLYQITEKKFIPLCQSAFINALAQDLETLELTKKSAQELVILVKQYKQEIMIDPENNEEYKNFNWQGMITGYNDIIKKIDEAILLSKYGKNMNENGNN